MLLIILVGILAISPTIIFLIRGLIEEKFNELNNTFKNSDLIP